MKRNQNKVNGILNALATAMIEKDANEWPPGCGLFMYQPHRPQRNFNATEPTPTDATAPSLWNRNKSTDT